MTDKDYSRQDRYNQKMEGYGFKRRCYWVHPDDNTEVIKLLTDIRKKRIKKITGKKNGKNK